MPPIQQAGRLEVMKIHGASITKKGDIGDHHMNNIEHTQDTARDYKTRECEHTHARIPC